MIGNGDGCLSAIVALGAAVILIYVVVTAAVFIAAAAGVVFLLAAGGAAFGKLRERKAENSNPNPVRDRSG